MYFLKQIFKVSFLLIFLSFSLFAQTNEEDTEAGSPANCPSCENSFSLFPQTNEEDTEAGSPANCPSCENNSPSMRLSKDLDSLRKANVKTCNVIYSPHNSMKDRMGLSDYWAQELIGADLLREELEKVPPPKTKNFIAVFDTSTNNHNVHVKNLISDEGTQAILPELKDQIVYAEAIDPLQFVAAAERFLRQGTPSFINNSATYVWEKLSRTIYGAFKSLSPPSVLVTSSGNYYPIGVEQMKSEASKEFSAIIVGSLSPNGVVSNHSSDGEEVHILAPADAFITTADAQGNYRRFGGTSGAAPLVTGSLAGFEWLSGYHPTAKESKILLEKTALPTLESLVKPRRNGVGLLNSYKLGMVAQRLKQKCQNKKPSCFKKEIENNENYIFKVDPNVKNELSRVFPSCAMKNRSKPHENTVLSSCEDKKRVFKQLRKVALLTSHQKEFLDALSCIYKEEGFDRNAKALKNLSRFSSFKREFFERLLTGMIEDFDPNMRQAAVRQASKLGYERGFQLLEKSIQTSIYKVKKAVVKSASQMGGPKGLEMLEKLGQDSNPEVRSIVAYYASQMEDEQGLEILEKLAKDPDPAVRQAVVYYASQMGGDRVIELLQQLAADENHKVRELAKLLLAKLLLNEKMKKRKINNS